VPQPFDSVVLDEVGSTNGEALARAAAGEAGPLWVVARRQTVGRGRSGRVWASEPGNLYASLLVKLACLPAVVPQLSLLAGVATVEAIAGAGGGLPAGLRLKWPNDVLIGQAKCAGILAESVANPASVAAVIGIGINLAWHPSDLGRAATHLAEHGVHVTPEAMLDALDSAMQRWLGQWDGGRGFARVREAWLGRAGHVGEDCTANTGTERIAGTFLGIDQNGALLLRDPQGRQRTVTFGDVALAATASGDPG
jgi:BirA family transcriptional regulator, biotin operon repressor / biotin---[acetyl-CoA-carboxylase] ligase